MKNGVIVSCSPSACCIIAGMTKKHTTPAVNSLTLDQAHELIHKLLDRITELEDRFNQHSGNSSKPPSVTGLEVLRQLGSVRLPVKTWRSAWP